MTTLNKREVRELERECQAQAPRGGGGNWDSEAGGDLALSAGDCSAEPEGALRGLRRHSHVHVMGARSELPSSSKLICAGLGEDSTAGEEFLGAYAAEWPTSAPTMRQSRLRVMSVKNLPPGVLPW